MLAVSSAFKLRGRPLSNSDAALLRKRDPYLHCLPVPDLKLFRSTRQPMGILGTPEFGNTPKYHSRSELVGFGTPIESAVPNTMKDWIRVYINKLDLE